MDTRQRILEAALVVFGRYGFRQASMERLAEEAGLSRQALYRHFASKEALFAACVEELHRSSLEAGREGARAARAARGDAADVLAAQLEGRFGRILERLAGSAHGPELLDESHRQCGAVNADSKERFAEQLAATVRAERRAGRLTAKGPSATELARLLILAADGIKTSVPPLTLEEFRRDLAQMVRLLVAGAGAPALR
jgi:AcrR family transcriptional regulator